MGPNRNRSRVITKPEHDNTTLAALEVQARRVYRRYQIEIVEGFSFCPWATKARQDGRVAVEVSTSPGPAPDIDWALQQIATLGANETVDIGLLLFPRVSIQRPAWESWMEVLRRADEEARGRRGLPFALAAFHPDAAANLDDPARAVPFIRRSPDPTIQLVRLSVLERVRGTGRHGSVFIDPTDMASMDMEALAKKLSAEPLHETVARANRDRIETDGVDTVEAVLREIHADRDASYAAVFGGAAGAGNSTDPTAPTNY